MGVIAKYKFNNTLADLLPGFNIEFTSDLYTVTDEVNGEVTTRTIESDSLPTLMRFGAVESSVATERSKSLLEIISLDISNCKNLYHNFRYCINLTTVNGLNIHSGITGLDNTFGICSSLEFVDTSNWDTSNVANMSNMFNGCSKLTSLDVSGWDTSSVTTTHFMFNDCFKLTSLDVSGWDTSSVTSMYGMFRNSYELTSLDVNGWDTSKVTSMSVTFYGCSKLTSLDVSGWDTSEVTGMQSMFQYCNNLTTLNVSNWNTSKVTDMNQMFYNCTNLTSLDVSNWNTSEVTTMHQMFYNCTNLTSLDVSNWNTGKVTNMNHLFELCKSLTYLDLRSFDTSSVTSMYYMFANCPKLISIDISTFIINENTNIGQYFANTNNLKYLKCNNVNTLNKLNTYLPTKSSTSQGTIICKSDITNLDTTTLQSKYWNILDEPTLIAKYVFDKSIYNNCIPLFNTGFEGYFIEDEVVEGNNEVIRTIESCGMLPTKIRFSTCEPTGQGLDGREKALLELLYLNTNNLTTEAQMFQSCINLIYVNTEHMINLHQTNHMFCACHSLTLLDLSNFDTSKVNNMSYMFYTCHSLTSLDVSNFDTSKVNNMECMFYNCKSLTLLDLSNWDTSNVGNMNGMFYGCNNLTLLDLSNFDTSNVINMNYMFKNTPLLTDISVLYMDKSSLQKLVDAMPTDLNKTLWYKDVNIDGITHGDNITLKKYMEGNVEIVLNSPLLEGDTIEVKDGKLCHVHRYEKVVLDGGEDEKWAHSTQYANGIHRFRTTSGIYKSNKFIVMSDRFGEVNWEGGLDTKSMEGVIGLLVSDRSTIPNNIGINLTRDLNNKIGSDTNGFIQWLSENPITVVYELETPYYEDITNLQSAPTLKTYLECSMEIDTDLPIDTNVTYRTNLSSVYVMERELDELDNGTDLGDILEGEVNE